MLTHRGRSRFDGAAWWAWRRDTQRAASLSRGNAPAPRGRGVLRLECRDGTHRLVPQHLALRYRADALPARPEGDEHRHASPRERLGALLRPGDFPGFRGVRGGAQPVADPAAAVVA